MGGLCHSIIHNDVPVLLSENLGRRIEPVQEVMRATGLAVICPRISLKRDNLTSNLEDSDEGPEQRVKVPATAGAVAILICRTEMAAKQIHAKHTEIRDSNIGVDINALVPCER